MRPPLWLILVIAVILIGPALFLGCVTVLDRQAVVFLPDDGRAEGRWILRWPAERQQGPSPLGPAFELRFDDPPAPGARRWTSGVLRWGGQQARFELVDEGLQTWAAFDPASVAATGLDRVALSSHNNALRGMDRLSVAVDPISWPADRAQRVGKLVWTRWHYARR